MIRKIKKKLQNDLMGKLLKNAGALLSGSIISSVLGLITLAITARALGPEAFGILVLIQTYILAVDGIMNFQSWQAVVKFGTDLHESSQSEKFKAMIKYILIIDIFTAVLAMITASILIVFLGPFINIAESSYQYVTIYSLSILFHISGVPIAVLRIFNKFKLFAFQSILTSVIKLISVAILYITEVELIGFILVWTLTDIIGHITLQYFGVRELKNQKYRGVSKVNIRVLKGHLKDVWTFVITTNLNSSIRMTTRQLDILIVGGMLGSNAVGLYKIAKQFSAILSKVSDPLYQAIYPQLTILNNQKRLFEFKKLMVHSSILVAVPVILIWIVFLIFGDQIITLTVGTPFLDGKSVMLWYMLAIVISVISFPLQPAMLAIGYPQYSFWVHLFSTVIYFLALIPLIQNLDIVGAGISYLLYYFIWSLVMLKIIKNKTGKLSNVISRETAISEIK